MRILLLICLCALSGCFDNNASRLDGRIEQTNKAIIQRINQIKVNSSAVDIALLQKELFLVSRFKQDKKPIISGVIFLDKNNKKNWSLTVIQASDEPEGDAIEMSLDGNIWEKVLNPISPTGASHLPKKYLETYVSWYPYGGNVAESIGGKLDIITQNGTIQPINMSWYIRLLNLDGKVIVEAKEFGLLTQEIE